MNSSSELVCTFVTKKKLDYKKLINFFSKIQNTNDYKILSNRALDLYCAEISKINQNKLRNFCFKNKIENSVLESIKKIPLVIQAKYIQFKDKENE